MDQLVRIRLLQGVVSLMSKVIQFQTKFVPLQASAIPADNDRDKSDTLLRDEIILFQSD